MLYWWSKRQHTVIIRWWWRRRVTCALFGFQPPCDTYKERESNTICIANLLTWHWLDPRLESSNRGRVPYNEFVYFARQYALSTTTSLASSNRDLHSVSRQLNFHTNKHSNSDECGRLNRLLSPMPLMKTSLIVLFKQSGVVTEGTKLGAYLRNFAVHLWWKCASGRNTFRAYGRHRT